MSTQEIVQTMQRIARHEAGQIWAPALGTVTSLHVGDDKPDYACTVRLRESGMVLPRVPIATGLVGMVAPPAIDDLVVVVFIGGDLHAPVVVGRLYHRDLAPPKHEAGEVIGWLAEAGTKEDETIRLAVRTPDGGPRAIELTIAGDVEVKVTVDEKQVALVAGKTSLTLSQSGGSDGKAELMVGDSSVVIEQGGDVTITAKGTLEIKANEVKISGDSSVKVTGQVIDLN
jgi:hypothetical protein